MKPTIQELCKAGILLAVMAVLSQISIPVPISPVPFSMGMMGLYIVSLFQRPLCTAYTLAAYLLLGLAGLPVFAGYRAGLGVLAGPTGGYLMAYLPAGVLASQIQKKALATSGALRMLMSVCAMLAVTALCYGMGSLWLAVSTHISFGAALGIGALPFLPMDMVKIAVTLPLSQKLAPLLHKQTA